jgi:very-short-patch-repair endonuclease
VARWAHGAAANPFESGLRAIVVDAGWATFVPQFAVPGTPYEVDLADPTRRICLEADSFAHHASRGALRNACRRYDELGRLGWLVLRFAWEQVMFEGPWVGEVVSDCCRRR